MDCVNRDDSLHQLSDRVFVFRRALLRDGQLVDHQMGSVEQQARCLPHMVEAETAPATKPELLQA